MKRNDRISITQILTDDSLDSRERSRQLLPLVYQELRALAEKQMHRERRDHTLQPTALVHEAYLKLTSVDRRVL